eukprot:m.86383 g.86383  ORF g.86383 m.86383 type:complete len:233 (+) comp25962_c0_seq1:304-1002(+)
MSTETISSYFPSPATFGRLTGVAVVGVGAVYFLNKILKDTLQEVKQIPRDVVEIMGSLVVVTRLAKEIVEAPVLQQMMEVPVDETFQWRGIFVMVKDIKAMTEMLKDLLEGPVLQGYVRTVERMVPPPTPLSIEGGNTTEPLTATTVTANTVVATPVAPAPSPDEIVKIIDASRGAIQTLAGLIALENMKSMVQVAIYLIQPQHMHSNLKALTASIMVVLFFVWCFFFYGRD